MSEKSQSLAGPASQYPPDPDDASSAHSQTPSSPSAAETTQFPRVEDEEYDAAGADDSFADDSQSVERSYHTDSFERVSDSSAMTVPPSQPTQHPQQGPFSQPQYSQEPNVQQYPPGYYAPQPQQQPLAPPQSNNSVHGLLIALLVVMTILLLICVPLGFEYIEQRIGESESGGA